jgi:hypothetical protein
MKLKHALTLLALSATAHGQLAVMHTNGVVVSPANVSVLRTSIGVPSTFGTGSNSVVGGGLSNAASGSNSAVVGGLSNTASGNPVTINGANTGGGLAFVGGGDLNTASGWNSAIVGGHSNQTKGWSSFIGGGRHNTIEVPPFAWDTNSPPPNSFSAIVGGLYNTNTGYLAIIGGGLYNKIDGQYGVIGGGANNEIRTNAALNTSFSVIPGGRDNIISARNAFAAGSYARAAHDGAFVYSDISSETNSFSSTNNNSFNIRAHGGISLDLGTNGLSVRGTNPLTFANPISVRGTATNINAEILWKTHDNIGNGGIIVQSRSQLTNIWDSPTNAHTNWSIMWIGQNIRSDENIGVVRAQTNTGAAYLSIENAYNYDGAPTDPSSEIYFTVIGLEGGTAFRPLTIRTAYTNTEVGEIAFNHSTSVEPKQSSQNVFAVNFSNAVAGSKNHLLLYNASTNNGRDVRLQMTVGTNDLIWSMEDSKAFALMNLRGQISYPFLFYTNGVVIGATGAPSPSARVHLAGDTYIDGNLSFANTTNQATTRTNLGLGGGITTNVSSGTLQFSNGILVGHTP